VIEVDDKKIAANKPRNIAIELLNVFEPQNPPCDTEWSNKKYLSP